MIQFEQHNLMVFQSALYQTTTAILKTKDALIMTDPNWLPEEIEVIKCYIEQNMGTRQLYIIFTHSDFDHIIAAGAFPEATIIASKEFVLRANKEAVLEQITMFDAQYYIERSYPIIYPKVDFVIEKDGQQVMLGTTICTFYLAPGHTIDGLFTIVEDSGILLAGDYLSDVEFPFIEDVAAYMQTLEKAGELVKKHAITTLVPGHGKTTADSKEIRRRIEESMNYIHQLKAGIEQELFLKMRYPFYDGLKEMHEANQALIKK